MLSAAADLPTPDGRAQSGAFTGLAETRKPEAAPILQDKAAYGGSPHQSRPAAVSALATLSKGMEHAQREAIAEQLRDLLRDPWPPVVWAAARGLVTMADTEALDALEAFRRPLSTQEQAAVDRLMAALRQEDKVDGSAVKKEVEDLRDKMRKLEEQIQTLSARLDAGPASSDSAPPHD